MSRVVELESAINNYNNALKRQRDIRRESEVIVGSLEKKVLLEILSGISKKLDEIKEKMLKIPTESADFSESELKIINSMPKIPDYPDIPDNSEDLDKIKNEIKKLSSTVLKFMSKTPEISVDPPDLSELNRKLDEILSKPSDNIIEKIVEKEQIAESKTWNFVVKRDGKGLISNIIAE